MDAAQVDTTGVYVPKIANELGLSARQIAAAAELLNAGSTVPFIARYRKEVTGGMDEVAVIAVRDRLEQLRDLDARRATILNSLTEQGKLSDELKGKVLAAETMAALEDIYLPYRPKRRTRGMMAREKGLEPLAHKLFDQGEMDPQAEAAAFVSADKGVASADEALAGARDIIAEWVNEDAAARQEIRELFGREAVLKSKLVEGKEAEGAKFKDYFDWSEPLASAPSHRILAVRRGAEEGVLSFRIEVDEDHAVGLLERRFVKAATPAAAQVKAAVKDSYKRLMSVSIETDARLDSKKRADEEAIRVFAANLRELLLASPLGSKRVMAIDPGFRTGCKVACMDATGKLLYNDVIYPVEPANRVAEAAAKVKVLCEKLKIEAIAVGNGTGGRETETFLRSLDLPGRPVIVMVNESGASVYSASEAAREEFPDHDLTVRGAVSIGRRLMDPLAELVKIDPKSIGVGQYQHDVDPKALKKSLDDTVVSSVNAVGVEVNTASKQLLSYVSGLSERLAGAIVRHREENGPFASRRELTKVTGMGPKSFEQAAGFLRVRESENPLDASAVHPESYRVVERMAADLKCTVRDLIARPDLRQQLDLKRYVDDRIGMPTLTDIVAELAKPGRDPRKQFEAFQFADVKELKDLSPGMKLPGIVTNVTAFGAFVDVGVHQDGLVHVSELADRFVKDPAEVVKVQQQVTVTVMAVDLDRKRISLSMKSNPGSRPARTSGQGQAKGIDPSASAAPRETAATPSRGSGSGPRNSPPARNAPPPRRDAGDPNNPFVDFFKNREIKKK